MSNYNKQALQQFVNDEFDNSALPSLIDYIKIPNLSRLYDPQWNKNGFLQQAANHIKTWVQKLNIKGLKCQIIQDEGYSPIIFTQIPGEIKETVFFYGHFDKQPPFQGWLEGLGPNIPAIRDGKLYGRGGADDGYSTYGTMIAIKGLIEQKIAIPRCVMITQGDEESGSAHMDYYIPKLKQKIGDPSVFFCLDSGALNYDTFWLTNSLRGNLVGTLKVEVLSEGVHSGSGSGVAPSCFRIARQLLSRIQNYHTGEIHQKLHVNIPHNRYKQNYDLAVKEGNNAIKSFPFVEGCKPISPNPLTCLLNRGWLPTITIIGQSGFPEVQKAGSVLIPSIQIKFSMRLPPTLNGKEAEQLVKDILTKDVPYNAKATVLGVRAGQGWNAPIYDQYLQQSVKEASLYYYKNQKMGLAEGASIPLINNLNAIWPKGQFIITGVLGPNSNAHGPNEFLHLAYTKKLICCISHILAAVSQHKKQKP